MKKYFLIIFLTISIIAKGQYYSITTIPYDPAPYTGTSILIGDNSFTRMIPIGFQFCFYGYKYDSLRIGSNGVVAFNPGVFQFDSTGIWEIRDFALPSAFASLTPCVGILLPWQDLNPKSGGHITYSSSGVTPNRVFVVSYDSVPMDSCSKVFKGQAKLFETTNIIETHIAIKDTCLHWNQGRAVHGLEGPPILPLGSNPKAYGDFISGRNYPNLVWTTTNEGTRFTPLVDVCTSLSVYENDPSNNNFTLYPNPATQTATLEFENTKKENCILTLYNAIGQIVNIISDITEDKVIIARQNLTSGLYFFRLDNTGKQTIAKGKLIIIE